MNKFIAQATFRDTSLPKLVAEHISYEEAFFQLSTWSRQFVSLAALAIFTPSREKVCFASDMTYSFTIGAFRLPNSIYAQS